MEQSEAKKRLDLIGKNGSETKQIKVVDALEYPTGVSVRIFDEMGDSYWTDLENVDLDH